MFMKETAARRRCIFGTQHKPSLEALFNAPEQVMVAGNRTGKAAGSNGGPCATSRYLSLLTRLSGNRWFQKFSSIQTLLVMACPITTT